MSSQAYFGKAISRLKLSGKTRRLRFVKNPWFLSMSEIIVISEHSQKSKISEAVRIPSRNSEVYGGVGDFANFYDL